METELGHDVIGQSVLLPYLGRNLHIFTALVQCLTLFIPNTHRCVVAANNQIRNGAYLSTYPL